MALRISTISFLERRRGAQSTWVLSDLWGQVKQNIPEGKLRIWATASPLPYHLASDKGRKAFTIIWKSLPRFFPKPLFHTGCWLRAGVTVCCHLLST